jgi:hypothetical protein
MSEIVAELMGKIKGGWGMQDEEGDLGDEEESASTEVECGFPDGELLL